MEPKASLTLEGKLTHRQLSDGYLCFPIGQVKLQKATCSFYKSKGQYKGGGGSNGLIKGTLTKPVILQSGIWVEGGSLVTWYSFYQVLVYPWGCPLG